MDSMTNTEERVIKRGDIYFAFKQEEYSIHPTGRPVLVVSSVLINDMTDYVYVIPCSKEETKKLPTHFKVKTNGYTGFAICEKPIRVPKSVLGEYVATISDKETAELDKRMSIIWEIGINIKGCNDFIKGYEKEFRKSEKKEEELKKRTVEKELRERVEKETQEYREREEELTNSLNELKRNYTELEDKVRLKQKEIHQLTEENKAEKTQVKSLNKQKEEYEAELKKTEEKMKSILDTYDAKIADYEKKLKELQSSEKSNVFSNRKIMELTKKIESYEEERKNLYTKEDMEKAKSQASGNPDADVEVEVITMERDMYKNKYMDALKKIKEMGA